MSVPAGSHHEPAVLPEFPTAVPVSAQGVPRGFRLDRTLRVPVELARQLRRRRTMLALGFMVALPLILLLAFYLGRNNETSSRNSYVDLATTGAANFTMVALFFSAGFLLVVVVSLFFGDTVASEASWSSLRYLLAMPVPRQRLLRQKVVAALVISVFSLITLAVASWVVGALAYGTGPLVTPFGDQFAGGAALARLAVVLAYIGVQLAWVAGLALLLSVMTDAPLAAVGGAVLITILSQILDQITALGAIRNYLPTHYSFAWSGAMLPEISWGDMTRGAFSALAYAALFGVLAVLRFRRKDITS